MTTCHTPPVCEWIPLVRRLLRAPVLGYDPTKSNPSCACEDFPLDRLVFLPLPWRVRPSPRLGLFRCNSQNPDISCGLRILMYQAGRQKRRLRSFPPRLPHMASQAASLYAVTRSSTKKYANHTDRSIRPMQGKWFQNTPEKIKAASLIEKLLLFSSWSWARTSDPLINSQML